MKNPEIIAHRGASHYAPENTISAFKLAFEQNADGIEGDFHLTKDGEIVCIHDPSSGRTANKDLIISKSTLSELKKLSFGSWKGKEWETEKIPTIKEVFSVIPEDKKIYIEIKCGPEILEPLKKAIETSELEFKQTVIISFNSKIIEKSKEILPGLKAYLLVGFRKDEKTGKILPTAKEIIAILEKLNADGADCQGLSVIDENFISEIRNAGKEIHIWTIDDTDTAIRFKKLGVDSLTSNRPKLLKSTFGVQ